jgi:hypothetical protein
VGPDAWDEGWLHLPLNSEITILVSFFTLSLRFCSTPLFHSMVTCSLVRIPLESLPSRMVARVLPRELAASWAWSLRK